MIVGFVLFREASLAANLITSSKSVAGALENTLCVTHLANTVLLQFVDDFCGTLDQVGC